MRTIYAAHPDDFKNYHTARIRERFLIDKQVQPDQISCTYTLYDRMIVGFANPVTQQLELPNYPNLRAEYFLERREIGIINVGGDGVIVADGQSFELKKLDCLYIGKGTKSVEFSSKNSNRPPVFYMLSCPAHATHPTTLLANVDAVKVTLGSSETANHRTINKYIHLEGIKSCQLVMGLTILHNGSVWNTMPPHVHDRRMEAYFYFDVPEGQKIFHYMGEGDETRHITMDNYDAVVSPPWSIHAGSGTASYSFIWGMAGENLDYTDMDAITIADLK
jgi:4-deoxy-L-threo-5-hexosulose-uronate ketol-isomerase